jgi:hypothetical protein
MKKILIGLVVIVAAFAGFVATRPGHLHIERSITVKAPPESAYAQVADVGQARPGDEEDLRRPAVGRGRALRVGGQQGRR